MKKISILLVFVAILASSCENFLDTEPTMKVSLDQYMSEEGGALKFLAGVYDPISADLYWRALPRPFDVSDEWVARGADPYALGNNIYSPADGQIGALWQALYKGVGRANVLIANIDKATTTDEATRKVILGEALFLRGYYYFILVSRFGAVPVRLEPTTSPIGLNSPRVPIAQVYEQIVKDMKAAEQMVAPVKYANSGRVSKTVVQGMLARVYLFMAGYPLMDTAKYADAAAYAKKVIDSGERGLKVDFKPNPTTGAPFVPFTTPNMDYQLPPNNAYQQIFINLAGKEEHDTRESLWEAEYKGDGTGGYSELIDLGFNFGIPAGGPITVMKIGNPIGKSTWHLFNLYDDSGKDLRREWNFPRYKIVYVNGLGYTRQLTGTGSGATFISDYPLPKTTPLTIANEKLKIGRDIGKYRREYELPASINNWSAINFPLLRYADVLLMYAEAQNKADGFPSPTSIEYVNQIRRRAYGLPIGTASPANTGGADMPVAATQSSAAFQQFIEDERARELCFEGLRHMDLIRWTDNTGNSKYVTTLKTVLDEINLFNPGYNKIAFTNASTANLLLPIPTMEAILNP